MQSSRGYFFTNMYLSSIQNGIQTAHCVHELFTKYDNRDDDASIQLWDWALNYKTIIVLNGGYHDSLIELRDFLNTHKNHYPWTFFAEEGEALNSAMTCVGIILPQRIYDGAKIIQDPAKNSILCHSGELTFPDGTLVDYNSWEVQLMNKLNEFHLAR